MPKRHFLIISIIYLALCLFYYLRMTAMTYPGFPLDDSWIHQVFAKNLATGNGFSFNPGIPISGATAPLWPLLLAPAWAILGPIAGGIILGIAIGGLVLAAVYKLTQLVTGDDKSSFLVTILTVLCWPLIWGALSGMEVPLYSALSLWGLYFYLKSKTLKDYNGYLAYVLFSLAFLSRPECGLFIAAAFINDAIILRKSGKRAFPGFAVRCLIVTGIFTPYFIFNYSTAGNLFPQTLTAKVQNKGLFSVILRGELKRIIKALTVFPYYYFQDFFSKVFTLNPIIIAAFIPGIIKLYGLSKINGSKYIMIIILVIFYTPIMGAVSPMSGATFQNFRFISNLLPILILIGYLGLFYNIEIDQKPFKKPLLIIGSVFIAAGLFSGLMFKYVEKILAQLIIQNPANLTAESFIKLRGFMWDLGTGTIIVGAMFFFALFIISNRVQSLLKSGIVRKLTLLVIILSAGAITIGNANTYANNVRNINECDVASGRFLAEIANPGDVVAVNDIGAIGYYSKMEIFDLKGLISPEVSIEMIANDSLAFEYMLKNKRVNYIAISPDWFNYIPTRTDILRPVKIFYTQANSILSGSWVVVYKALWPDIRKPEQRVSKQVKIKSNVLDPDLLKD